MVGYQFIFLHSHLTKFITVCEVQIDFDNSPVILEVNLTEM